jgi:hypothetical protein
VADPRSTSTDHRLSGMGLLDSALSDTNRLHPLVAKRDLEWGDRVIVTTKNSTYSICYLGDDQYAVSGGWFDRLAESPAQVTINGCTWGGSIIKQDIVAAPGLFLEFGNRVMTTRIRDVQVIRCAESAVRH